MASRRQRQNNTVKFEGSCLFRQRLVTSLLSCRPIRIDHIRVRDELSGPGLQDFEANFLRLVEKLTDGT